MKGYLRIFIILVAAAPLALLGCGSEKSPTPDADYVDTAANPSALPVLTSENPADAAPAAAEEKPGE